MTLSDKISACRRQQGLSQEALAAQLNVSRQAVSKWETGDAEPESGKLVALAQTFDVTVDWLLSETAVLPEPMGKVPLDSSDPTVPPKVRRHPYANLRLGYLFYLVVLSPFVLVVEIAHFSFSPEFQIQIYFSNLANFFEPTLLLAMPIGSLLLLSGSRLLRPAGQAFRFMFCKSNHESCSSEQAARCRLAVRAALAGWVLGGLLLTIGFIVQSLAAMTLISSFKQVGGICSMVLCLLFYIVIGFFLLLPIDFSLRKKQE